MASTILAKRSAVAGKTPTTTDLALGELGINTHDGKLFIKKDDGTESIVEIGKKDVLFVDANANISPNQIVVADTRGAAVSSGTTAYTLTLPASPNNEDYIQITDGGGNAQNRPILVDRNGNDIDYASEDLTCDVDYFDIKLVYKSADSTWTLSGK